MKHEFAPWRSEYFSNKTDGCVFCQMQDGNNDENFILFRAQNCFGVMNRYPYTLGEFMVIPYLHTDNIESLDEQIWQEMSHFVRLGVGVLKDKLHANGVNIGMNLGAAAGAGIAEHIHYHLVPRWSRDTNFITTIGYTRIHGVPFYEQYKVLKEAFDEILK
ncbi:HIT family hydrolase, FHIT branch [Campylobacter iguaniorum]|uniref:HIT family hydrolase, FHIT branch n=1 Tax=Campylobacter iguaniorum TaxID=1244531 RepID=A0A076FFN9_9BACT|nr:HIT domain-containing protein [Campylobacter iguaniorum]AII14659.1 HIT family hydrolase, FHIT branch [Campylobacter iguaniorum]ALV24395.1 HIT family hydrolase, FHIT branch [Campylobacter iguaniorum]ANE35820.1 HIT family hydrolase, FHIT branch [Campylobacter iguaniorum]